MSIKEKSNNKRFLTKIKGKHQFDSALFLTPSFVGVLLFLVLPFIFIIYFSFVNNPIDKQFVFLDNFIIVLKNKAFQRAVLNTLKFSLLAVPSSILLSLGLAILLDMKIPFKSQFRAIFLSTMMVPVASVVLIWKVLFDNNGVVNEWFQMLGWNMIDWMKSEYSIFVLVLLFLWKNSGYFIILFMAAISNFRKYFIEVAALEGASKWQLFIYIKLRYLSPTILFVTILSLINSFKIFREVYLLTDKYPYDGLYMLQHFMNNIFLSLDYQKLSAAAIIMAFFMILIIGALFLIESYFGKDVED